MHVGLEGYRMFRRHANTLMTHFVNCMDYKCSNPQHRQISCAHHETFRKPDSPRMQQAWKGWMNSCS